MKKKLSLFLAMIFALSAFTLAACTDKKDEQRELDSVEKSIVGTWTGDYGSFVFNSDGTYSYIKSSGENKGTFKHDGSGGSSEFGRFEVISLKVDKLALLENYPDRLYTIITTNGDIDIQFNYYYTRQ